MPLPLGSGRGQLSRGCVALGNGAPQESLHQESQNARAEEEVLKLATPPPLPARPWLRSVEDFYGERSLGPRLTVHPSPRLPLLRAAPLANGATLPGGATVTSLDASWGRAGPGKALT